MRCSSLACWDFCQHAQYETGQVGCAVTGRARQLGGTGRNMDICCQVVRAETGSRLWSGVGSLG